MERITKKTKQKNSIRMVDLIRSEENPLLTPTSTLRGIAARPHAHKPLARRQGASMGVRSGACIHQSLAYFTYFLGVFALFSSEREYEGEKNRRKKEKQRERERQTETEKREREGGEKSERERRKRVKERERGEKSERERKKRKRER